MAKYKVKPNDTGHNTKVYPWIIVDENGHACGFCVTEQRAHDICLELNTVGYVEMDA